MTLQHLARRANHVAAANSPAILTAMGVAGTLGAVYLTGKASFKATKILEEEQYKLNLHELPHNRHTLDTKEKVKLVWKLYIPAAGVTTATIAAVVLANQIGTRRGAAVAAALAVSERAASEYADKVKQVIGEKKEREVREEIQQDRLERNPVESSQVIITSGTALCYESYTDRYFTSDMETLKKAMNDTNYKINTQFYQSLSDFYDRVGLPHTKESDNVGWNSDQLMDISFGSHIATDGRPCLALDYTVMPKPKYDSAY